MVGLVPVFYTSRYNRPIIQRSELETYDRIGRYNQKIKSVSDDRSMGPYSICRRMNCCARVKALPVLARRGLKMEPLPTMAEKRCLSDLSDVCFLSTNAFASGVASSPQLSKPCTQG